MQTALTFVAILSIVMLFLCGTWPTFILLAVLAAVSMVCCIVVSYILRKRTDEKDAKDAALQNKITNWRKVRRRQLISDDNSDGMFDTGGIIQDLRLSQEEDPQCRRLRCTAAAGTGHSSWVLGRESLSIPGADTRRRATAVCDAARRA